MGVKEGASFGFDAKVEKGVDLGWSEGGGSGKGEAVEAHDGCKHVPGFGQGRAIGHGKGFLMGARVKGHLDQDIRDF